MTWTPTPARAGRLFLRKTGLFFNGHELPQLESFDIARERQGILRILFVKFWFLGALGLIGILFSLRRWRELFPLWGFILVYALTIIAFFRYGAFSHSRCSGGVIIRGERVARHPAAVDEHGTPGGGVLRRVRRDALAHQSFDVRVGFRRDQVPGTKFTGRVA